MTWDEMAKVFEGYLRFETCPHCGQLIKKED
jgi:hypothetical protein